MRRTSYISAGYLIAEVTAVVLTLIIIFTYSARSPRTSRWVASSPTC